MLAPLPPPATGGAVSVRAGARAGIGVAARWYCFYGDPVAAHALPRAAVGLSFPVEVGPVELSLGGGLECDLLATGIGYPGAPELVSPITGRFEIEVVFEPERRLATSW